MFPVVCQEQNYTTPMPLNKNWIGKFLNSWVWEDVSNGESLSRPDQRVPKPTSAIGRQRIVEPCKPCSCRLKCLVRASVYLLLLPKDLTVLRFCRILQAGWCRDKKLTEEKGFKREWERKVSNGVSLKTANQKKARARWARFNVLHRHGAETLSRAQIRALLQHGVMLTSQNCCQPALFFW